MGVCVGRKGGVGVTGCGSALSVSMLELVHVSHSSHHLIEWLPRTFTFLMLLCCMYVLYHTCCMFNLRTLSMQRSEEEALHGCFFPTIV